MDKEFFKRFTEWQNYAHYLLNAVFITFYYVMFGNFSKMIVLMFIELAVVLFISDILVHLTFGTFKIINGWIDKLELFIIKKIPFFANKERNRKIVYYGLMIALVIDVILTYVAIEFVGLNEQNQIYELFKNFNFTLLFNHFNAIVLVILAYQNAKMKQEGNRVSWCVFSFYFFAMVWNSYAIVGRLAGWR